MAPDAPAVGYIIWGVDHVVYGPVDLPVLVGWIKDERVLADTWLFVERNGCWEQAERVPELKMFFHRRPATRAASAFPTAGVPSDGTLSAGALRHIKVLGCLTDEQLEQFLSFAEVQGVAGGSTVVKRGEPANAMFLIVEGQIRYSLVTDGHEVSAGTLNAGESFGEISLFDQGVRCADVIAMTDCTLLKICNSNYERLSVEMPVLAAPFLAALTKSFACRFRSESRRYRDSLCLVQQASR